MKNLVELARVCSENFSVGEVASVCSAGSLVVAVVGCKGSVSRIEPSGRASLPLEWQIDLSSEDDHIVFAEFLKEDRILSACSRNGDVFVDGEVCGTLDSGIVAARWAPDQEVLAVLTGLGTIAFFSKSIDFITEVALLSTIDGPLAQGSLTWRGDGKHVACVIHGKLYVVDRDGTLRSTSEAQVPGLSPTACAWRPEGSIIAVPQFLEDRGEQRIAFFERNGLQHYDMTLGSLRMDIRQLVWNSASDLLAVVTSTTVFLYHRNNYHWFLKRELRLRARFAVFDSTDPYVLFVSSANCVDRFVFRWDACCSNVGRCPIGVVDGNAVNVTYFAEGLVPPPMYAEQFTCRSPVSHFFVSGNAAVAQLVDDSISVLLPKKLKCSVDLPANSGRLVFVLHEKPSQIMIGCAFGNELRLFRLSAEKELVNVVDHRFKTLVIRASFPVILTADRSVYLLNEDIATPPTLLFQIEEKVDAVSYFRDTAISLCTSRNALFVGSKKLTEECTSFLTHDEFLLFTTSRHDLFMIPHRSIQSFAQGHCGVSELLSDANKRQVERGSILLAALHHSAFVVLEMPRGNLEGIQPRVMMEWYVKEMLSQNHFREAVISCRKHKIEMDFIPAHCAGRDFSEHAAAFVLQIPESDVHDLFLTQQSDRNVPRKNAVCSALRAAYLSTAELSLQFHLPVITSFVRQSPADVVGALSFIALKCLREQILDFDSCIRHLGLFVDVDVLYRESLGTYDFELAHRVAEKTQQDPREYGPFLAKMERIEPSACRKFEIDVFLGRYAKAISHGPQALDLLLDRCCDLISKHDLYTEGIALFPANAKVCRLYADFLVSKASGALVHTGFSSTKDMYAAAGSLYLTAQDCEQAFSCFGLCGDWKTLVSLGSNEKHCLVALRTLEDLGRFKEAVEFAALYLDDAETAIDLAAKHDLWMDGYVLACHKHRKDLIVTNLLPPFLETVSKWLSMADEWTSRFPVLVMELRQIRARMAEEEARRRELGTEDSSSFGPDGVAAVDDDDRFSDASTVRSRSSRHSRSSSSRSTASTASTKKLAKRLQTRQGPEFDEENQVRLIRHLLPTETHQMALKNMIQVLVYERQLEKARALQNKWIAYEAIVMQYVDDLAVPLREVVTDDAAAMVMKRLNISKRATDLENSHLLIGKNSWMFPGF
eukprot:ANDGO_06430.mRNA.1 Elongator complex protein 1